MTNSMLPSAIDRNVPPVSLLHRQMRSTNGEVDLRSSNFKNTAAPHDRSSAFFDGNQKRGAYRRYPRPRNPPSAAQPREKI
jgi:hypothetical protein